MNTSRVIWVNGKPYYAGGTLKQSGRHVVGENSPECFIPKGAAMKRINVRDQWEPAKILGTLPWDGVETERRFSWQQLMNGHPTQNIIKLQVHRMIIGDTDEMAYNAGLHKIEILRKLPDFCEKTDER